MGALSAAEPAVRWICSTPGQPWTPMEITAGAPADKTPVLEVDPGTTYQVMDGFGGCFNDLGWQALLALPVLEREAALKALFDPTGANFTLCRMPMGANDFSLKWYSFDETPGDYAMRNFSISRDREDLIPYIRAAMQCQPGLGVWGVPWSPPTWMKTNGRYKGGEMKQDPRILAAYALYFSKYVQAYRDEGIRVYAVMPQNEPIYNDGIYPQCDWSPQLLNLFLRDYLIPRLHQDHVKVQVWLGTIVSGKVSDYIDPVLGDPVTHDGITGVGCQYGGQAAMLAAHERYPSKKLAQTETECYNGQNAWLEGMATFEKIISDTDHFASSYFYWNMVLDEGGRSSWNWRQNSLLTVDRKKDLVIMNPEYYAMKHFSANVLPGARRIGVTGGLPTGAVAFVNPSGNVVVEFENQSPKPLVVGLTARNHAYQMEVPARSMDTVIIAGN